MASEHGMADFVWDDAVEDEPDRVAVFGAVVIAFHLGLIFSGVAGMNVWTLIGASIIGRGIQFFGVAAVVWYFGDRAKALIEKHMTLVTILFAVVLIGGFVAVKYLA